MCINTPDRFMATKVRRKAFQVKVKVAKVEGAMTSYASLVNAAGY